MLPFSLHSMPSMLCMPSMPQLQCKSLSLPCMHRRVPYFDLRGQPCIDRREAHIEQPGACIGRPDKTHIDRYFDLCGQPCIGRREAHIK